MSGDASRQIVLLDALDRHDCRTVERLADIAGIERRAIVQAAAALVRRGYADRAERGCFLLTAEGEAARAAGATLASGPLGPLTQTFRRPQRITLQDKLWRALRSARKATVRDLLRLCDRDDGAGLSAAQRYLKALGRAGYVRTLPRRDRSSATARTSNGYLVWLLVRDTGPLAPAVRASRREVWDRNLAQSIALEPQT